jgi:hypothetical protein
MAASAIHKREILTNVKPCLWSIAHRAGHTLTNYRTLAGVAVAIFDGNRMPIREITRYIDEHYTVRHMHTGQVWRNSTEW